MDNILDALAAYAGSARAYPLSDDVRAAACAHIVDTLGCAIGGVGETPARIASDVASGYGRADGPASLIGAQRGVSVDDAGFANGCMARCLDFNDVYSSVTGGHPP